VKARRPLRAARAGFTILEVLVSSTVFMLVAGAVVTTLVASSALNDANRETVLAAQAAESMLEQLKGAAFSEVFARFNATKGDDPAAGVSPGSSFAVHGLSARAADADGQVGRIEFPGDGLELREDVKDDDLGLPRDMNRDGDLDTTDHADDYRILPVRVVLEWHGISGNRTIELVSVLVQR